LQDPPKFTQIGNLGLKINHLPTVVKTSHPQVNLENLVHSGHPANKERRFNGHAYNGSRN
jgi:hypothetical protein